MDTIFPSPPGDGTAILRGQAVAGQRKVPSFLSYSQTLSIVPLSGIEPATN